MSFQPTEAPLADRLYGEARNVAVLLAKAGYGDLKDRLKQIRGQTYEEAIAALGSSRARALMLDLTHWLHCGPYLTHKDQGVDRDARTFAASVWKKCARS